MNYMGEVAEMLGVKLGEDFKLRNNPVRYRLVNSGLEYDKGDYWSGDSCVQLSDILIGKYEIVKNPWKPRINENYYYVTVEGKISKFMCVGHTTDEILYKMGNCFRTKEEITQEIIDKYVAFYNSDERIEIQ